MRSHFINGTTISCLQKLLGGKRCVFFEGNWKLTGNHKSASGHMYVCRYVNGSKVGGVLLILFFFFFWKGFPVCSSLNGFRFMVLAKTIAIRVFRWDRAQTMRSKKKKTGCRFTNINFIYVLLGPLFWFICLCLWSARQFLPI